jgi:hypothetical protein
MLPCRSCSLHQILAFPYDQYTFALVRLGYLVLNRMACPECTLVIQRSNLSGLVHAYRGLAQTVATSTLAYCRVFANMRIDVSAEGSPL